MLILGIYTQSPLVGSTDISWEGSRLCSKAVFIHLLLTHQIRALTTFQTPALQIFQTSPPSCRPHRARHCTTALGFLLRLVTQLLLPDTAPLSCSAPPGQSSLQMLTLRAFLCGLVEKVMRLHPSLLQSGGTQSSSGSEVQPR